MFKRLFNFLFGRRGGGSSSTSYGSPLDASSWSPKTQYAKQELNLITTLRDSRTAVWRMRSEYRNNEVFSGPIDRLASWVTGSSGISIVFSMANRKSTRAQAELEKVMNEWKAWSVSMVDAERNSNLFKMQNSIATTSLIDGFLFFEVLNDPDGGIILKTHNSDRLAIYLNDELENGNYIRLGCEYNRKNVKVAHYFRRDDTKKLWNNVNYQGGFDRVENTIRMPVETVQILTCPKVAGMPFELPELVSIFLRGRDIKDYQDAEMAKQKLAAAMAAFVTTEAPDDESPLRDMQQSPTNAGDRVSAPQRQTNWVNIPGAILEYLRPGESVEVPNAPSIESYKDYISTNLTMMAMSLGVSKETLTMDYSQTSFSSARMAQITNQPKLNLIRSNIIKSQFLGKVVREFLKDQLLKGNIGARGYEDIYWQCIDPVGMHIDPIKAAKAQEVQLANGVTSLTTLIQSSGHDPESEFGKMIEEREKYKELFDTFTFVNSAAKIKKEAEDEPANSSETGEADEE